MFHTVNDLERIGDLCENIADLAQYSIDNNLKFSEYALKELKEMYDKVYYGVSTAVSALENMDMESAMKVFANEDEVDAIEKKLRNEHIDRLNKGICVPASGAIFLDLLSNLERIADHAKNVAQIVSGEK